MNGLKVSLRALEPEDLSTLYRWENDVDTWSVSETVTPFSKHVLTQYLETAHLDIYTTKQFRFVIVENTSQLSVGTIDLFDFEPQHHRAGVGLLIDAQFRNLGYASEALSLFENYCFNTLHLHQIYANISIENIKSIALFEKHDYQRIGLKKEWRMIHNKWTDELLYQKIQK
jgi:diamine N-acetyltransferase